MVVLVQLFHLKCKKRNKEVEHTCGSGMSFKYNGVIFVMKVNNEWSSLTEKAID